jgi:hypothetical protein
VPLPLIAVAACLAIATGYLGYKMYKARQDAVAERQPNVTREDPQPEAESAAVESAPSAQSTPAPAAAQIAGPAPAPAAGPASAPATPRRLPASERRGLAATPSGGSVDDAFQSDLDKMASRYKVKQFSAVEMMQVYSSVRDYQAKHVLTDAVVRAAVVLSLDRAGIDKLSQWLFSKRLEECVRRAVRQ